MHIKSFGKNLDPNITNNIFYLISSKKKQDRLRSNYSLGKSVIVPNRNLPKSMTVQQQKSSVSVQLSAATYSLSVKQTPAISESTAPQLVYVQQPTATHSGSPQPPTNVIPSWGQTGSWHFSFIYYSAQWISSISWYTCVDTIVYLNLIAWKLGAFKKLSNR